MWESANGKAAAQAIDTYFVPARCYHRIISRGEHNRGFGIRRIKIADAARSSGN
jgi:hypothetical protein